MIYLIFFRESYNGHFIESMEVQEKSMEVEEKSLTK